jgi:hypothetical protein
MNSSEYFKAMFNIGMIESNMKEIKLEETLIKQFKFVLKIAYGFKITDEEWNTLSLLEIFESIIISNKYQFTETETIISNRFLEKLISHSTDFITEEINYKIGDNKKKEKFLSIFEVYELSKSYHLNYFSNICGVYIENKANQVMDGWKFLYNYWW